jgi:hypothetical protein
MFDKHLLILYVLSLMGVIDKITKNTKNNIVVNLWMVEPYLSLFPFPSFFFPSFFSYQVPPSSFFPFNSGFLLLTARCCYIKGATINVVVNDKALLHQRQTTNAIVNDKALLH